MAKQNLNQLAAKKINLNVRLNDIIVILINIQVISIDITIRSCQPSYYKSKNGFYFRERREPSSVEIAGIKQLADTAARIVS